jgi:hypothetical protein
MNEFIPRSDPQLCLWLENYSKRIAVYGARFGLTPEEIAAQQRWCAELTEAIKTDDQKLKEWRAAVKVTREAKKSSLAAVRAMIERIKHLPGWTPSIGQAMGVVKKAPPPTPMDAVKPKLQVVTEAGQAKLKFTRRPLDGINVYMRRKGETQWRLVARATRSPFTDPTALLVPNTSEIREYRAMGVRKDQEVGQPSDVVVAVVGA